MAESKEKQSTVLEHFKVERDPSGRAKCRGCYKKIPEGEVCISKRDTTGEYHWSSAYSKDVYGHFHLDCFAMERKFSKNS